MKTYNVSRLWWIPFLIGIVAGVIVTLLWNLLIGAIAAVVVFFIFACMGESDEDILKKKAEAGDQDAQKELDELIAKEAEKNYNKGLQVLDKKGGHYAKTWFEKAAKQGHSGAKDKLVEIEREAKAQAARTAAERKAADDAEKARLAELPKCPYCKKPIEQMFVNNIWGWRYYHAVYAPECSWRDDRLRNPYIPPGYVKVIELPNGERIYQRGNKR